MARRNYSGAAAQTTLSADISSSATTFTVPSGGGAGYPSSNFVATLERGTSKEEKVFVGTRTSDTFSSITRGWDGTTAQTHTSGATVDHTISATDLDEANALVNLADAKGDIPAATAADTWGRLAVGTNDQILMADSAQSTGLKWAGSGAPSTQAFGDSATEGTTDGYARTDHKHAMPADPVTAHAAAADPHTGYVLESLFDTKGDIIAATADNTPARKAVGADDTILMADSAQADGLKWAASGAPGASAVADTVSAGTADTWARSDHRHSREGFGAAGYPVDVQATEADGSAATLARSDHQHKIGALPAARVTKNATQSVNENSATAATWNTENYDTDTIHDNATNNSRLTCKTAGKYRIFGSVQMSSGPTSTTTWVRIDGTTLVAGNNGQGDRSHIYTEYELAVNQYAELVVFHTGSGTAENILTSESHFGMSYIQP